MAAALADGAVRAGRAVDPAVDPADTGLCPAGLAQALLVQRAS